MKIADTNQLNLGGLTHITKSHNKNNLHSGRVPLTKTQTARFLVEVLKRLRFAQSIATMALGLYRRLKSPLHSCHFL
jgi:hypothetical protein